MGTFSSLKFSQTYIEDGKISSRNMRRGAELNTISNINSSINSNYNVQNPNRFKTLSNKLTITIESVEKKGEEASNYFTFILPGTTVKIPYLLGNGVQEITVNNIMKTVNTTIIVVTTDVKTFINFFTNGSPP